MGNRPIVGIFSNQGRICCVNTLLIVAPDTKAFQSLFATGPTLRIAIMALHINGTIITRLISTFFASGVIAEHCTKALVEMLM
jgi:hypothetical protein